MPKEQALSLAQVQALLKELPGWVFQSNAIQTVYKTDGWPMTLMVVNAVGFVCEAGFHHPDLNVSWGEVTVRLWTHSAGGITNKDFEMARRIDKAIRWGPGPEDSLTGPPKPIVK